MTGIVVCEVGGAAKERGSCHSYSIPVDPLCKRSVVFGRSDGVPKTRISAGKLLVQLGSGAIRTWLLAFTLFLVTLDKYSAI